MPEKNTKKTNLDEQLPLIFALGGETLPFFDINGIATLLTNHTDQFSKCTQATLRKHLDKHPHISTTNGNYYSCSGLDLESIAMDFLALPCGSEIAHRIALAFPYASTDGAANPARLTRDVKNSLFAKDLEMHKRSLEALKRDLPNDLATGKPLWFLADPRYIPWLRELPAVLLSLSLRMIIPHMTFNLLPVKPLLESIMPRMKELAAFAIYPLLDVLLLAGETDTAQQVIDTLINGDHNTLLTRRAWLDFLQNQNQEAINKYAEALEDIRRKSYGNDLYFGALPGLFFIFALIKENTPATMGHAYSNTRIGLMNPLLFHAYQTLHGYIDNVLRGTMIPPHFMRGTHLDIDALVKLIVSFWHNGGKLEDEQMKELQDLRIKAQDAGFQWVADECQAIVKRTQEDWMPFQPTESVPEEGLATLVDCVKVMPPWTKELNAVSEELSQFGRQKPMRAAWLISFSPYDPTEVVLELCEQHLTKTERWSTGHRIYLERLSRELKLTKNWPAYFTLEDIKATQALLKLAIPNQTRMENANAAQDDQIHLEDIEGTTHNDILLTLKNYPRLFWRDDNEQNPVKIIIDQPFIRVKSCEPGKLLLSVYPKVGDTSHLAAVKYEDNSLHLFCYNQMQKRIAKALGEGVIMPEQALPRLYDSWLKLASIMKIKSDHPLDALKQTENEIITPKPIIRLERKSDGLGIELLMEPFGENEAIHKPSDGPQTILTAKNNALIRKTRDCKAEQELAEKILAACTTLTSYTMVAPYQWHLDNGETVFQFMLQIRKCMGFCSILWKQDRKILLSRKIGFGDVHMRAQRTNNWLEVDGDIVVDENLTVSFQKILELAKQQKGNFITLDDGQVLTLADDLRNTIDNLNKIGQSSHKGPLQFNSLALPALQIILDNFKDCQKSDQWENHVRRIDEAQHMDIPAPDKLSKGTILRDYQLEGYKWLMRLDHWGAGACLADDMGLGKTLQAIAFIRAKTEEGPTLVVAPTSVCHNWIDEIQKFAPSLQTVVFGQGNRKEMLQAMKPGMVMISSYGLLQSQIDSFSEINWRIVVLDEAQAIKHFQAKRSQAALQLKAQFKLATTGTPIENNLGELWTLFQFITPGLFGSRQAFQDKFTYPIERDHDTDALQRLSSLIKPFLLRRKKDEILTELPPKTEVQLNIDLSTEERAFYEAVRQKLLRDLEANNTEPSSQYRTKILAAISKLRQAACNPLLIEPGTKIKSAKLEEFKQLVQDLVAGGHKTLVFSQFVRHLDIIRPCLNELNITYDYLVGETPSKEREEAEKNFQNGKSDLFLISLRAGGLGLNLTRADYVIILDPWWNPAVEEQAADRAHRLGQKRPVTIYRLIAKNTIEDKIIELHKQKQDLAVQLLDGADTAGTISAEELLKLLQESHN